ncbi:MAG: GAF domain-containing protein [Acidobacteria bacterium]|nr:GAF domain-containing protein [Acidobacteriota bacterium]
MGAPLGVARVIAEMVKDKGPLDAAVGNQVAGAIAKHFKVKPDEVAILRMSPTGKQLEFIVPEKLGKVGTIPMTSTNALAVRTARDKRTEFVNNFTAAAHPTVFEAVKLSKEGGDPIQKIISIPVLAEGKTVGVIQVSRKGKTTGAAGPDFGPKDVEELNQIATTLVPCLKAS